MNVQKLFLAITVLFSLMLACSVNPDQKDHYDTNKFILISALLEDHFQKNGEYPNSLVEIEAAYKGFLANNPGIKEKYFRETWTRKKVQVPFLKTSTEEKINYLASPDKHEYFLWAGFSSKVYIWDLKELEKFRDSHDYDISLHLIAFICNGKPKIIHTKEVEKITFSNMESILRETKPRLIPKFTF